MTAFKWVPQDIVARIVKNGEGTLLNSGESAFIVIIHSIYVNRGLWNHPNVGLSSNAISCY